ncbi:MAG TPA: TadE family protein [Microbacteriaceae bacterium]|nr:TadE family protein [Microbacteriaceae bacterium]
MRCANTSTNSPFDRGSAAVEFVTLATLLLVPLVYLIIALGSIQAGALASEGAARQAARVWALQSPELRDAAAARAVAQALNDFGFTPEHSTWHVDCPEPCAPGRGIVTVRVEVSVPLPLVPPVLDLQQRATVQVAGAAAQPLSRFGNAR